MTIEPVISRSIDPPQPMPGPGAVVATGAIMGSLVVFIGFAQVVYPLWFDQGAFASCADVLLRGGALIRDCWDTRGAGTPLVYALARAVSSSPAAVHGLDLLWQAVTAVVIMLVGKRLFASHMSAVIAAGLYILLYGSLNYWAVAQAEGFANLLVMMAIGLALIKPKVISNVPIVASGVACGLLFWFKYPFALFAVLPFGILLHTAKATARGIGALAFMMGIALALGGGFGLLVIQGTLQDWVLQFQYDLATFNDIALPDRWAWFADLFMVEVATFIRQGNTPTAGWKDTVVAIGWLGRGFPFLFAAVGASVALLTQEKQRSSRRLILAYLFVGILINIWQGHSYRYHFVVWLPALASCAGSLHSSETPRLVRGLGLITCGLAAAGLIATTVPWTADAVQNLIVEHKTILQIYSESNLSEPVTLAKFIRDHTRPDEPIVVFSDVPSVYVLADRPMGTRFPYYRWADEGRNSRINEAYSESALGDLLLSQPRYFILTKDGYPWPEARFIDTWKRVDGVHHYIETQYHYALDIGNFIVFERNYTR